MMTEERYLPEGLRQAATLVYEALIHGEDFESFCRRSPTSKDDFEIWQALDEQFGDDSPVIRGRFLEAGEARRCRQATLEGYLRMLEISCSLTRAKIVEAAGISEAIWDAWLLAEDDIIPGAEQLEGLIAGAALGPMEAAHLRRLREETLEEVLEPLRRPGLAQYLRREPAALGPALAKVRGRKGFSVDLVAAQAGMPADLWRLWEDGREMPDIEALDEALKKLHWIWATDDALRGWTDEVPAPPDAKLWKAFLNDHEWEETGAQEAWLLPKDPTPESVEAWRQVALANERRATPDLEAEAIRALAEERERAESTLAGFLRFRRETRGVTVEEMAGKAGVEVKTWLAWESGEVLPALPEVEALGPRIFVTPWLRERLVEIWRQMAGGEKSTTSA